MNSNSVDQQPQKSKIYVTPKVLLEEYHSSLEQGAATDKLLKLFTKIARHFGTTFNTVNKCDFEACVNYAVAEAWQKWDKFNNEKSDNIFSFYTTMIANDMRYHYKQITRGKELNISIEALFSGDNK